MDTELLVHPVFRMETLKGQAGASVEIKMSSKISTQWHAILKGLVILLLLSSGAAYASDRGDHERARQAVEAGEVLPLRTILERVEREYPGQVMAVELDREKDEWLYEVRVLRKNGALVKLKINARDGALLGIKEKHDQPHRSGERH